MMKLVFVCFSDFRITPSPYPSYNTIVGASIRQYTYRITSMAVFSNQATLTYNGTSTNSNIAYGEILDVITAAKTAVEESYAVGELVTYVVSITNTSASAITGLIVTDDLGGYPFGLGTVYPLAYEAGSLKLFVDGTLMPAPAVSAGPPLEVTGINIPASGNALLVYQTRVTSYAPPAGGGAITNTVTVTGDGLAGPVTASATIGVATAPELSILKSICPARVTDNDRVTYTFVIQNSGNTPLVATDNSVITDIFDPVLSGLVVTFNGTTWTEGVQYDYDESTGTFQTVPGVIVVDAATYTQDPVTGEYSFTPGVSTLTVTGTI